MQKSPQDMRKPARGPVCHIAEPANLYQTAPFGTCPGGVPLMDIPLTISGFSLEHPPSIGPSAPAYNAGLHNGDIILSLADRPVTGIADLRRIPGNVPVGESAEIEILRRGHCVLLDVTPV